MNEQAGHKQKQRSARKKKGSSFEPRWFQRCKQRPYPLSSIEEGCGDGRSDEWAKRTEIVIQIQIGPGDGAVRI